MSNHYRKKRSFSSGCTCSASLAALLSTQQSIPSQCCSSVSVSECLRKQKTISSHDDVALKGFQKYIGQNQSLVTEVADLKSLLCGTDTTGAPYEIPPLKRRYTYALDKCFHNIWLRKKYPVVCLDKPAQRGQSATPRSKTFLDMRSSSPLAVRSFSMSKKHVLQDTQKQTKTVNKVRLKTHKNNMQNSDLNKSKQYDLTAWRLSQEEIVQSSCQDDLSVLRNAILRSPPHDLVNKVSDSEKHVKSKFKERHYSEYFNNMSSLPSNANNVASKKCICAYSDDQSVSTHATKSSEMYISDNTSSCTRGTWSPRPGDENERTSLDFDWDSQSEHETQTSVYCKSDGEKCHSTTALKGKILVNNNRLENMPQHFMRPISQKEQLLKRHQQQCILSKLAQKFSGLENKSQERNRLNLSEKRSAPSFDTLPHSTMHSDSSQYFETNGKSFPNKHKNTTISCVSDHNLLSPINKKRDLRRAISFPTTSSCSEKRVLQFLALSFIIDKLLPIEQEYGIPKTVSKIRNSLDHSSSNMHPQRIITKQEMQTVASALRKRAEVFNTHQHSYYYVWKRRILVFLVTVLLLGCFAVACIATIALNNSDQECEKEDMVGDTQNSSN